MQKFILRKRIIKDNEFKILEKKEIVLRDQKGKTTILNLKCDLTPSNLISFIVTDSKIFRPSAISDELIKLFNS